MWRKFVIELKHGQNAKNLKAKSTRNDEVSQLNTIDWLWLFGISLSFCIWILKVRNIISLYCPQKRRSFCSRSNEIKTQKKNNRTVIACLACFWILYSDSADEIIISTTLWCISQFEVSTIFFVFFNLLDKTTDCCCFWRNCNPIKILTPPQIRYCPWRKLYAFAQTFWSTRFPITSNVVSSGYLLYWNNYDYNAIIIILCGIGLDIFIT